jgi:paraquat-inducible protein B
VGRCGVAVDVNDKARREDARTDSGRTKAEVRYSRWPGWIWAIPIAALLLIGWWGFRALTRGGEDITITFDDAHGLKAGSTNVVYRGLNVGKVTDVELAKDGSTVDVTVHVEDSVTGFLTSGTQFWLRGASPSFSDPSSLASVVTGPTIGMEPGPGQPATHFVGRMSKPVAPGGHGPPKMYAVSLTGSVGGLKRGDPVKLRGFTVGEIEEVGFRYDAGTGELATPVTLALYPSLFHIAGTGAPDGDHALAAAIDRLIQEGLRAKLKRDPPLIGGPAVTLDIVPDAPQVARATVNGVPEIPAAPGRGIDSIVDRVGRVPVDEIAQNVLDVTRQVDTLVSSSKLEDSIGELDATLKQLHRTVENAGPKITKLAETLRKTAGQLDEAARQADKVLGGTPSQTGTQEALREIADAARSVRELADYLDRHPEALIEGRSGR